MKFLIAESLIQPSLGDHYYLGEPV